MSDVSITSIRGIQGEFYLRLEADRTAMWPMEIGLFADSNRSGEEYPHLDDVPMMEPDTGGTQTQPLTGLPKFVRNVRHKAGIEIPEEWFRRDMTGQIATRIDDLVRATNTHWAHLVSPLIINGTAGLATDGKNFFATDHERGISGVQSNLLTISLATIPVSGNTSGSTPTDPAVNHMQYAITKAIAQMRGFVSDKAQPLNESAEDFVWFGPTNLGVSARAAVDIPRGTDVNEVRPGNYGPVRVVDTARANAWTDRFALFRRDTVARAFILQQETAPMLQTKGPGSEHAIDTDSFSFVVKSWRQADYGMWQHGVQVILTA